MEYVHEEECATCPNLLRCLVQGAAITSCTPNIAQSVSAVTLLSSRTPHIQRTIALSFQLSRCKSGAVCAQVSLLCNRAEWTGVESFPPGPEGHMLGGGGERCSAARKPRA